MHRKPQPSQSRGFSFVEILVVMGIIGVLMGGVLVVIGMTLSKQRVLETRVTVHKTTLLVEDWHRHFERYPPSAMTQMGRVPNDPRYVAMPPNQTNDGIETIYQALYWPGFDGLPRWQEEQIGNTDVDRLPKPVNAVGTVELSEIVDAWGNPLVYFSHRDYRRYVDGGARYVTPAMDVEPRPHLAEEDAFARPLSFQVFSMGPDGRPNTEDDIGNWGR